MSPLCVFLSSTVQDCTDCLAVLSSSGKVQIRFVLRFFSYPLLMPTLLIRVPHMHVPLFAGGDIVPIAYLCSRFHCFGNR